MSITLKDKDQRKGIKGKHKYKIDYGLIDYYKYYKKHADSYVTKSKFDTQEYEFKSPIVNKQDFSLILKEYYSLVVQEAMNNNESIHLPNLGSISILKYKPKTINKKGFIKLPVDWATSKKVGKKVFFTNDDRDGYVYKWFWTRKNMKVRSLSWYKYIPTRDMKRTLRQVLRDKTKDYFIHPYK